MKIYTKTGDAGETSLFDNSRVTKADPRVDAYGEVDEVNACLGAAIAAGMSDDIATVLVTIQKDLFAVGARLADPASRIADRVTAQTLKPDPPITQLPVVLNWFTELRRAAGTK